MKKIILVWLVSIISLTSAIYYNEIVDYFIPAVDQTVVDASIKLSEEELTKLEQEETTKVQSQINSINQ
jgi:uncharacterized protein YxeA